MINRPRYFFFAICILIAGLGAGFERTYAAASDCRNPTDVLIAPGVSMKFCEIPAANGILIGSEDGHQSEKPVLPRNFKSFQIGQFEVSQLQYKTITGKEPWAEIECYDEDDDVIPCEFTVGDNYPAFFISSWDADQVADALMKIDKTAIYRLPTEAEFEYATRAGTSTNYFWGDVMDPNMAFYLGNSYEEYCDENAPHRCDDPYLRYASEVGMCPNSILIAKDPGYCANQFGLFHMLGNVAEFTADSWGNYKNAPLDGNTPFVVPGESRVVRGGSWESTKKELRSASRGAEYHRTTWTEGMRLVRIPR